MEVSFRDMITVLHGMGFGALWETSDELVAATTALFADPDRLADERERAVVRAREFGTTKFQDAVRSAVFDVLNRRCALSPDAT